MKLEQVDRPSPELRGRLLTAARRTLATRPGAWRRRVLGAGLFSLAWTVMAAVTLRARPDLMELPRGPLVQTFGALLGVATAASAVALTRGPAMVGATFERLAGIVAVGLGVLLVLVLAVDPEAGSTRIFAGGALWWHAVPCALMVFGLGLPLLAAGLVPLAGLTLGRPGLTGGCVGLAAATLAHLLIRFHCAVGGSPHALLGHLLPEIPLMVMGAWWSRARVVERLGARFTRAGEEKS